MKFGVVRGTGMGNVGEMWGGSQAEVFPGHSPFFAFIPDKIL
jgi:hypothetical protein